MDARAPLIVSELTVVPSDTAAKNAGCARWQAHGSPATAMPRRPPDANVALLAGPGEERLGVRADRAHERRGARRRAEAVGARVDHLQALGLALEGAVPAAVVAPLGKPGGELRAPCLARDDRGGQRALLALEVRAPRRPAASAGGGGAPRARPRRTRSSHSAVASTSERRRASAARARVSRLASRLDFGRTCTLAAVPAPLAVYTDVVGADPAPGRRAARGGRLRGPRARDGRSRRIAREAAEAVALLIGGTTPVGAELLAALPRLRIVATMSVGLRHGRPGRGARPRDLGRERARRRHGGGRRARVRDGPQPAARAPVPRPRVRDGRWDDARRAAAAARATRRSASSGWAASAAGSGCSARASTDGSSGTIRWWPPTPGRRASSGSSATRCWRPPTC